MLFNLGGNQRYAAAVEPLIYIIMALLPLAASANHTVDIKSPELASYLLEVGILTTLHKTEGLCRTFQRIFDVIESHREEWNSREYLSKIAMMLYLSQGAWDRYELPTYRHKSEVLISEMGHA